MIQLNYRDPRPIYEQVKDGIRKLAYSGVLGPDDKLPSVRELAMKLAINPNTISRAYKELEQEGFIYSVTGRGTFINQEFDLNDSRREELWQMFEKAVKALLELSVSVEEMNERIHAINGAKYQGKAEKQSIENSSTETEDNRKAEATKRGGSTDDSGK